MVSGADELMAVFRWGRRLPAEALGQFGLTQAPCHATYHSFFKAFDVASAEQVLGVWSRDGAPLGHVAIDGKRLRGSASGGHDGREGVHLVSAFASRLRAVVGQMRVEPGANEITTALARLRNTVLRLLQPFPIPTRAARQVFAENRSRAIELVRQGFL